MEYLNWAEDLGAVRSPEHKMFSSLFRSTETNSFRFVGADSWRLVWYLTRKFLRLSRLADCSAGRFAAVH